MWKERFIRKEDESESHWGGTDVYFCQNRGNSHIRTVYIIIRTVYLNIINRVTEIIFQRIKRGNMLMSTPPLKSASQIKWING